MRVQVAQQVRLLNTQTFDELSNKISQIPIEVPMGSAMEQNGGVLPFFDVYNETLKAMASVGTEFNGCCAFELDKWSYDNDHKVTLSGADAYYTSDGTFIDKEFNIKENGSVLDKFELDGKDAAMYQFKDTDKENTNRFVVFFFSAERYTVPKCLHATSCLNLWCVKGTPLMNFSSDFTRLNSINVYDGELVVKDANDFAVRSTGLLTKLNIPHIVEIAGGDAPFYANNLIYVNFTNLTTISGGTNFLNNYVKSRFIDLPKLHKASKLMDWSYPAKIDIALGNGTKDGIAGDIRISLGQNTSISNLTVAKDFKANLNLTYCFGLSKQCVLDIFENLADLTEEGITLNIIFGSATANAIGLTEDDYTTARVKGWTIS